MDARDRGGRTAAHYAALQNRAAALRDRAPEIYGRILARIVGRRIVQNYLFGTQNCAKLYFLDVNSAKFR